ncbi:MAG: MaoC family dehydratase [Salinisphaera sp.]|jgi:acyl dehydratase|nr:MaoC family dehydratase [Salinisphaera sp.]
MRYFESIDALADCSGQHLGTSAWRTIDQTRIARFSEATDDHQWIHVDVERATHESPLGGPVAHGFLTLSLLPAMMQEVFDVAHVSTRINYGLDSLRFITPVAAGARIRADVTLADVSPRGAQRYLLRNRVVVEIENGDKPAAVADTLTLYIL